MSIIEEKLKLLPSSPGSYQMLDKNGEKVEPKVENIEVKLEDEEEIEFKPEEMVEEKAQEKEELDLDDGVEQVSIDLDDEGVEMLNDILNVGGPEKTLNKGPVNK